MGLCNGLEVSYRRVGPQLVPGFPGNGNDGNNGGGNDGNNGGGNDGNNGGGNDEDNEGQPTTTLPGPG